MTFPPAYHGDSDADDEYERSLMTSPILPTDDDASPTDSDPPSTEHTPTTFGPGGDDGQGPRTIITEWTADECAGFIRNLGLQQYCGNFLENEIVGEALVALRHEELKEMGVASVGHRLTILKGVYDVKTKQDIPMETDHYVPLSADASLNNKKATQEDISRIIRSISIRDERILLYEEQLKRMQEEYRKLRDELLPVFRMAKESQEGLSSPTFSVQPQQATSATLTRKLSSATKKTGYTTYANSQKASPTYIQHSSIPEGKTPRDSSLDPSAAALAASSHLTASMAGSDRASPNPALPSPTSPHTYLNQPATSARGGYPRDQAPSVAPSFRTQAPYSDDLTQFAYTTPSTASTLIPDSASHYGQPTPTPGRSRGVSRDTNNDDSTNGREAPSVEIFKSFRVSMEDPCYKVLPAALKKYAINADWRQYALYIVYGDQERCLGLEEKPLILFKQLDKEGRKPMFMLRRHAAPQEGHQQSIPMQLPGGVI